MQILPIVHVAILINFNCTIWSFNTILWIIALVFLHKIKSEGYVRRSLSSSISLFCCVIKDALKQVKKTKTNVMHMPATAQSNCTCSYFFCNVSAVTKCGHPSYEHNSTQWHCQNITMVVMTYHITYANTTNYTTNYCYSNN